MLESMTAYGQSLLNTHWGELGCEIRSVNHRYLDVSVRLPEGFGGIEARLRDLASSRLGRGKVDIALTFTQKTGDAERWVINPHVLSQLGAAIDQIKSLGTAAERYDPVSLLQWPGLLSVQSEVDNSVLEAAVTLFEQALLDFSSTRLREGEQIADMIDARASELSRLVEELRVHRPSVVLRQRKKLLAKLAQLDVEHDAARLEQELVYAAQRLDIDEELDRLDAHLRELSQVLQRREAVGRRLDFLMQEFNREANTIASKASDSDTTSASIDMKVLIEQIREQVQNVE